MATRKKGHKKTGKKTRRKKAHHKGTAAGVKLQLGNAIKSLQSIQKKI